MKNIFCLKENKITEHNGVLDHNNEFVFTCETCGCFVKFPSVTNAQELLDLIAEYEAANQDIAQKAQTAAQGNSILEQVLTDDTTVLDDNTIVRVSLEE